MRAELGRNLRDCLRILGQQILMFKNIIKLVKGRLKRAWYVQRTKWWMRQHRLICDKFEQVTVAQIIKQKLIKNRVFLTSTIDCKRSPLSWILRCILDQIPLWHRSLSCQIRVRGARLKRTKELKSKLSVTIVARARIIYKAMIRRRMTQMISMEATLIRGQYCLINKFFYLVS